MTRRHLVRTRRGSALLLVLVAMVVLAVLASASMMSAFQEARSSRAAQIQQRALAVAEFALNQQLSSWPSQRGAMATGAIDSITVGVDLGDTAIVRVQRLSATDFNVVSVGRAGIGNGLMEAQRQVSLLVKMNAPTIRAPGLLTVNSNLQVQGSPLIDGTNRTPSGWTTCGSSPGPDTVAVAFTPGRTPQIQRADQVVGGTRSSTAAADTSTYSVFGGTNWAALTASATIRLSGSVNPAPIGTATSCVASSSNWGEPLRGNGSVSGCQNYFPVVYAPGDLQLGNGRGQGILLVQGSLKVTGNFYWTGIIIVRDFLELSGTPQLVGSVLVRSTTQSDSKIGGNASMQFSSCAVQQALAGLGSPIRTAGRAWANVY